MRCWPVSISCGCSQQSRVDGFRTGIDPSGPRGSGWGLRSADCFSALNDAIKGGVAQMSLARMPASHDESFFVRLPALMGKIDLTDFRVATSETARDINRRIVLNLIRPHHPISRADLARQSGLQRRTVSLIAEQLIEEITDTVRKRSFTHAPARIVPTDSSGRPRLLGTIARVLQKHFGAPSVA